MGPRNEHFSKRSGGGGTDLGKQYIGFYLLFFKMCLLLTHAGAALLSLLTSECALVLDLYLWDLPGLN